MSGENVENNTHKTYKTCVHIQYITHKQKTFTWIYVWQ